MAIPIPKRLLPHTAELYNVTADAWQNKTDTLAGTLNNVRIEPSSQVVFTPQSNQVTLSALMYYDCVNSSGADGFEIGQVVVFNNVRYTIQTVDALYDARRLHHYEVGLIK